MVKKVSLNARVRGKRTRESLVGWVVFLLGVAGCVTSQQKEGEQYLFGSKLYGTLTHVEDLPLACRSVETVVGEKPSLLPDGHSFKLVWHDEFNGTRLDESKWSYRTNFWGRRFSAFAGPEDDCIEVRDGKIHLKLKKRADGQFCSPQLQTGSLMWDYPPNPNANSFWPLAKRQPPKFEHCHGYYEARVRLQRRKGWWSAFWMQSETQGTCLEPARAGIEHDIMESFFPGCVGRHMFHMNGYGEDYVGYSIPSNSNHTLQVDVDEYHTFGLLWERDGYTVFVDGRRDGEKRGLSTGDAVSQVPEFLLISTECQWYRLNRMSGPASEDLDESARLGDDFVVDYVRVYDVDSGREHAAASVVVNDKAGKP